MSKRISVIDLSRTDSLDRRQQAAISGRGVASGYLFMSAPSRPQTPVLNQFFSFDTLEVNNYQTNNYIDKLIQQTVNQNQLNVVSVQSGDGGVNVNVDQGQGGANSMF